MDKDDAIKVEGVCKSFRLPIEKTTSIKGLFINIFRKRKGYQKQDVIKDISFNVKKGEFFGIVGKNGSGKSTLLKMMAGIYTPNSGAIKVYGTLSPFIELGVGFNPELTGKENVFLNGSLLGFNRREIKIMYNDIVDFAELHRFMDQKLKNYSSGMQVRLAFSIAIRARSDILLIDEVLAVGDASFQQKCYEKFEDMKLEGKTVVLVTHDMSAVQRFCDKALMIENGKIKLIGKPNDVADKYLEQNLNTKSTNKKEDIQTDKISIRGLVIKNSKNKTKTFNTNEDINIEFLVINKSKIKKLQVGFQIFNANGTYCFGTNGKISGCPVLKSITTNLSINIKQNLVPGNYYITLAIMNENASKVIRYIPKIENFNIRQEIEVQGIAILETSWRAEKQG